MAVLPPDQAQQRLQQNEDKFDKFINTKSNPAYQSSEDGSGVKSIPTLVSNIEAQFAAYPDAAGFSLLAKNYAIQASGSADRSKVSEVNSKASEINSLSSANNSAASALAGLTNTTYANIATGRAAVADNAVFWVRPNNTDNLKRVTLFQRNSSTTQTFVADNLPGKEFDSKLGDTLKFLYSLRDSATRLGYYITNFGQLCVRSMHVGVSLFPLKRISNSLIVRSETGQRQARSSLKSGFLDLEAARFHNQDYSYFKPVRSERIVGDEGYYSCLPSTTAGRSMNTKKEYWFPAGGREISFAFQNSFWAAEAGSFPSASQALAPITVSGSVFFQGRFYQLKFKGSSSVILAAGETVRSDTIYIDIPPLSNVIARFFVVPSANGYFPVGTPYIKSNDGVSYTANETDQTLNSSYSYPAWTDNTYGPIAFGAIAIVGKSSNAPAPAIALVSDSIGQGSADSLVGGQMGWAHRIFCSKEFCFVNLAQPSEKGSVYYDSFSVKNRLRWVDFVDYLICTYGVNDLSAGTSLNDLKLMLLNIWKLAKTRGCEVYQGTITPVSSSTDGFTTLANQTTAGFNDTRTQLNDWIRSGAPIFNGLPTLADQPVAIFAGDFRHPLTGYLEIADQVESSRNSGKWAINNGALTSDGTHPNSLGHKLIGFGVNTGIFV